MNRKINAVQAQEILDSRGNPTVIVGNASTTGTGPGLTGLAATGEQSYTNATVTRSTQYAGKQSI